MMDWILAGVIMLLDDCAYTIQVLTEKNAELVTLTRPMRPASAPIRNNLTTERKATK